MKKNYTALSILVLSMAIVFSAFWLGIKIESNREYSTNEVLTSEVITREVFTIEEVAEYLKLSEQQVEYIIAMDNKALNSRGSFTGRMFPYFEVNDQKLFYKEEVDLWLKEAVTNRKQY